jgi:hypothetical protein
VAVVTPVHTELKLHGDTGVPHRWQS